MIWLYHDSSFKTSFFGIKPGRPNAIVVESADDCAVGPAGNFRSKVLFETKESEALGETTVLQTRLHPGQQKFFDLLGTRFLATGNPVEIFSYWKSRRDF